MGIGIPVGDQRQVPKDGARGIAHGEWSCMPLTMLPQATTTTDSSSRSWRARRARHVRSCACGFDYMRMAVAWLALLHALATHAHTNDFTLSGRRRTGRRRSTTHALAYARVCNSLCVLVFLYTQTLPP